VRTKRLSGRRSKCPGATWGRHESDARTAGGVVAGNSKETRQREFTPSPSVAAPPPPPPRNKGKLKKTAFPRPAARSPRERAREAQRPHLSSEQGGTQHAQARGSKLPPISSLLPPCEQRHMHRKDLIFEAGVAPSDLPGTSRNRSVSRRTVATAWNPLELWLVFLFLGDRWSWSCASVTARFQIVAAWLSCCGMDKTAAAFFKTARGR
jgi:hypothetical protein